MRKFFIIIFSTLFTISLYAQSDRKLNNWVAHANFTYNELSMSAKAIKDIKSKGGYSIDFGAKQFFLKSYGWFMEESFEFFYSDLPHATYQYEGRRGVVYGHSKLQEKGVGGIVLTGYDFRLSNIFSCEVFAGFNYRRITKYKELRLWGYKKEEVLTPYHFLVKNDQKWKFGVGFNYKKLNVRCSYMPNKRETRVKRKGHSNFDPAPKWTTTQWTLGVGYYF
ncbi:MAG: hypothetical protein IKS79_01210 [Bacteroidales bacterium]|nr:hypothetical protein [Bacteroidales bacterium]